MVQESFLAEEELEEVMRTSWTPCLDWSALTITSP